MRRAGLWIAVVGPVVLAARALAYQLAASPTALTAHLQGEAGGPRFVVVTLVAVAASLAGAAALLWLASTAVRERHAVASRPGPRPSLRIAHAVQSAALLFVASSIGFAALESFLHWRAGLGFHGLQCLVGPEHRDALPLLAALSTFAAACEGAVGHLLGWMRRTLELLVAPRVSNAPRAAVLRTPRSRPAVCTVLAGPYGPRGPPALASV
jgi:hypothetical protein